MKKVVNVVLLYVFSTTAIFAEHVQPPARPNVEQMLHTIGEINVGASSSNNLCDISQDSNVKLINKMIDDKNIKEMNKEEFSNAMLTGLDRTHAELSRQARMVLSPRGLFEGRRDARAERRINRLANKISSKLNEDVSIEDVRQRLEDDLNPELQKTEKQTLQKEIAKHNSPLEFLENVKKLAIEAAIEDCSTSKASEIDSVSRGIASDDDRIIQDSCIDANTIGGFSGFCRAGKLTLITLTVAATVGLSLGYGALIFATGAVTMGAGIMSIGIVAVVTFVTFFAVKGAIRRRSRGHWYNRRY